VNFCIELDEFLNVSDEFQDKDKSSEEQSFMMFLENTTKRFHFIGIGGSGMSGIAQMCLEKGFQVTGSDLHPSRITNRLQGYGAVINFPHSRSNVSEDSIVVISSAIPDCNEELSMARELGLEVRKRAEVLAWLMKERDGIAVAGTHGKTTTTSMVSAILTEAGVDPSTVVGGEAHHVGGNAKFGNGKLLVAEADESDGSFLLLPARYGIVTNIDDDHLSHYGSFENLKGSFLHFCKNVEEFSVLCGEDENLLSMKNELGKKAVYYGYSKDCDYQITDVEMRGDSSSFFIRKKDGSYLSIRLNVPGEHNILNAASAVALCEKIGIATEAIYGGLNAFGGVQRRFELVNQAKGVRIFDDYAHHPTEVKAVLECGRRVAAESGGKLIVCFQPHRYSRLGSLIKPFAEVLSNCDFLYLAPVYSAGEKPVPGVDSWQIYRHLDMCKSKVCVLPEGGINEWAELLSGEFKSGDVILTLGAGNITALGRTLKI
jgi:UDP-N-acetylmuramate--alanine ligase